MVITKTPFRISFFGGGTDYPVWYKKYGGSVISTSINKYCYITTRFLPPFFNYKYRVRYTFREETKSIGQIKHPSVRECLRFIGAKEGTEMVHHADLPAMSGLGSSSSFTVGFLNSLYALKGQYVSKNKLANDAIYIEQKKIKESVGSQDQVIAAHGGFNKISFDKNGHISVNPVKISKNRLKNLHDHLLLFFTGFQRYAPKIASQQIKNTPSKYTELKTMMDITNKAHELLISKKPLKGFGKLLHESWMIKKSLASKISNPSIDEIYSQGLSAGALGGKILGAGGGGFILFFIDPSLKTKLRSRLKKILHIPFDFESYGSQIIYQQSKEHYGFIRG